MTLNSNLNSPLSIISWNANGFSKHKHEFQCFLEAKNIDIALISPKRTLPPHLTQKYLDTKFIILAIRTVLPTLVLLSTLKTIYLIIN